MVIKFEWYAPRPQLSLVLINRPRRDGTLSWRWHTAAVGGIRTHDGTTSRSQVRRPTTRLPVHL